jgi:hypothetical protein
MSDKPPAGARGHRVVLTRAAADAALASLLGMGLDYTPALDRHDTRRKIGVITRADIVGRKLELGGICSPRTFPRSCGKLAAVGQPGEDQPLSRGRAASTILWECRMRLQTPA